MTNNDAYHGNKTLLISNWNITSQKLPSLTARHSDFAVRKTIEAVTRNVNYLGELLLNRPHIYNYLGRGPKSRQCLDDLYKLLGYNEGDVDEEILKEYQNIRQNGRHSSYPMLRPREQVESLLKKWFQAPSYQSFEGGNILYSLSSQNLPSVEQSSRADTAEATFTFEVSENERAFIGSDDGQISRNKIEQALTNAFREFAGQDFKEKSKDLLTTIVQLHSLKDAYCSAVITNGTAIIHVTPSKDYEDFVEKHGMATAELEQVLSDEFRTILAGKPPSLHDSDKQRNQPRDSAPTIKTVNFQDYKT